VLTSTTLISDIKLPTRPLVFDVDVNLSYGSRPMAAVEEIFLPDPDPREPRFTVISVDDHVVEPRHMFEGRLPRHLQERAPRIVETRAGHEVWEFEGQRLYQAGMNAIVGRRRNGVVVEPLRFEHMRPGCYDVHARIKDMDINGVWAAVNFPSMIAGFCGRVFSQADDAELGLAATRAWNDWFFEEWHSAYPDRLVPLGITFLTDPDEAVKEIKRNAERGFTSASLPERAPHRLAQPVLGLLGPDHPGVCRDWHRHLAARRFVGGV